nr:unnamed protein product [Callosobruchus analis]
MDYMEFWRPNCPKMTQLCAEVSHRRSDSP